MIILATGYPVAVFLQKPTNIKCGIDERGEEKPSPWGKAAKIFDF